METSNQKNDILSAIGHFDGMRVPRQRHVTDKLALMCRINLIRKMKTIDRKSNMQILQLIYLLLFGKC